MILSREAAKLDAERAIRELPWLVPLTPDEEQTHPLTRESTTMACTNRTGNADDPAKKYPRPEPDPVNHPSHYSDAGGHEPIKVIEAWDLGFHLGNTVKYIARAGKKDPNKTIEDLKKAAWYLARHIENLENDR